MVPRGRRSERVEVERLRFVGGEGKGREGRAGQGAVVGVTGVEQVGREESVAWKGKGGDCGRGCDLVDLEAVGRTSLPLIFQTF